MNTITQSTVHLLLPGKLAAMAEMYANDYQVSMLDALRNLYRTPLYRRLEREETKLWHRGPVALYEEVVDLTM